MLYKIIVCLSVFFITIGFGQHIENRDCPSRPILPSFDLSKYLGRWYEISRYDQEFSKGCDCGYADYTLNQDGTVHVKNCCKRLPNTTTSSVIGKAAISYPDEDPIPGKLSVAFRGREPSVSNYWILDTDYDNFVIVYYCRNLDDGKSSEAFWLLSRAKILNTAVAEKTESYIKQYFDPNSVRVAKQDSGACGSDD